ncbi:hypothetical protein KLP28_10635 [Nocardioidaceae bacterium]|nr:hypothetical protein KLP28_10635 [Nocardioidaceae bacterium]
MPHHGIGGAADLPLPLGLTIAAAAAALVASVAVAGVAWTRPRYSPPPAGRPLPRLTRVVDSTAYAVVVRGLGLVAGAWFMLALVAGQDLATNPVFGVFYVLVWVGLVPASLLLGPVVRWLSPVRTLLLLIGRVARIDPAEGLLSLSPRVGVWPAALTLLAFTWQELVNPQAAFLDALRIWIAGYLVLTLIGGLLFGTRWLAAADPFEVYSELVARLSPWDRDRSGGGSGTLVLRSPLAHLASAPVPPGVTAVVAVLLGTTAYDSLSTLTPYVRFVQDSTVSRELIGTAVMLGLVLLVGALLVGGAAATPTRDGVRGARATPGLLAHALVPIAVGYALAHYLSTLPTTGLQTIAQLSDPLGRGWDVLGTAGLSPWYVFADHPSVLATSVVLLIVGGHVLGALAAHDRALTVVPPGRERTSQLPLLVVMVAITVAGLGLLFAG